MVFSWKQKREIISEFIHRYYADTLSKAGFVSYKDIGFSWYKVKNGLLYIIHTPVFSPAQPLRLQIAYGVIPLFSWEFIGYTSPSRDWGMRVGTEENYIRASGKNQYEIARQALGSLPRFPWSKYAEN